MKYGINFFWVDEVGDLVGDLGSDAFCNGGYASLESAKMSAKNSLSELTQDKFAQEEIYSSDKFVLTIIDENLNVYYQLTNMSAKMAGEYNIIADEYSVK